MPAAAALSRTAPALAHTLSAAHASLHAQLSPDLLPLLKEIWATGPRV
jgi:hypothetical protein